MIEAIVLAAGLSRRMGKQNKLSLAFRETTILQHTLSNLLQSKVDQIHLILGHEADQIQTLVQDFSIHIVVNEAFQAGQLTSIQKGLSALSKDCQAFMVCLSDMPFLESVDYNLLIDTYQESNEKSIIVIPKTEERSGNPKLFSIDFKPILLDLSPTAHKGARKILKQYQEEIIYCPANEHFFMDIDTPEAYARLHKI